MITNKPFITLFIFVNIIIIVAGCSKGAKQNDCINNKMDNNKKQALLRKELNVKSAKRISTTYRNAYIIDSTIYNNNGDAEKKVRWTVKMANYKNYGDLFYRIDNCIREELFIYDIYGNITESIQYEDSLLVTKNIYKYDKANFLIQEYRYISSSDSIIRSTKYKYLFDSLCNVIEKAHYGGFGKEDNVYSLSQKFKYNSDNLLSESRYYSSNGSGSYTFYEYDNKGNLNKSFWDPMFNNEVRITRYLYDDNGLLIKEVTESKGNSGISNDTTYYKYYF